MALLHRAELRPTKLELLQAWLPTREWHDGPADDLARVGAFRFDDPAGEVGVEILIVRTSGGSVVQAPLTYRAAPLDCGDAWLIGTLEHSVLGTRWVYDGCGDPVYATAVANAILAGYPQAEEFYAGEDSPRTPSAWVRGPAPTREPETVTVIRRVSGGDPTIVHTDTVEIGVVRRLDQPRELPGAVLTATWDGQAEPLPLAYAVAV